MRSEVDNLRELMYVELGHRDRALQIQATEYERRLGELNHAHERAQETQSKTVSREAFDAYKEHHMEEVKTAWADLNTWRNSTDITLAGQDAKISERAAQSSKVWAAATTVIVLVLNIIIRFFTPTLGH